MNIDEMKKTFSDTRHGLRKLQVKRMGLRKIDGKIRWHRLGGEYIYALLNSECVLKRFCFYLKLGRILIIGE